MWALRKGVALLAYFGASNALKGPFPGNNAYELAQLERLTSRMVASAVADPPLIHPGKHHSDQQYTSRKLLESDSSSSEPEVEFTLSDCSLCSGVSTTLCAAALEAMLTQISSDSKLYILRPLLDPDGTICTGPATRSECISMLDSTFDTLTSEEQSEVLGGVCWKLDRVSEVSSVGKDHALGRHTSRINRKARQRDNKVQEGEVDPATIAVLGIHPTKPKMGKLRAALNDFTNFLGQESVMKEETVATALRQQSEQHMEALEQVTSNEPSKTESNRTQQSSIFASIGILNPIYVARIHLGLKSILFGFIVGMVSMVLMIMFSDSEWRRRLRLTPLSKNTRAQHEKLDDDAMDLERDAAQTQSFTEFHYDMRMDNDVRPSMFTLFRKR